MSDTRIPFAHWQPLPEAGTQGTIVPRVLIFHSVGGAGNPWSYFASGSNLESTGWIALDGTIHQFMGADDRADANYHANGFAASFETENHPGTSAWDADPWTPEQVASATRLCDWYSDQYPVARQLCPAWDGTGYGYHVQFGSPGAWTPVAKACPGARRIEQFKQIVVPAACGQYTQGEPVTDADMLKIIAGVDHILKNDRDVADARVNAYVTNGVNRAVKDLGGSPSKPNKPIPEWP